jgi:hypothetical protein
MKKLLRLLAVAGTCWLVPQGASAQYYYIPFLNAGSNPGGLNTEQELPGAQAGWATIQNGSPATRTAPAWTSVQSLPFPFQFNGQPFTRFRVATSGVLSFDTTATAVPGAANTGLPAADVPANSICAWGLTLSPGDYIISKTFGTAPNRQHWIQFNSASQGTTAAVTTFWSIVLQESTNTIYIVDHRTTGGNLSLTLGVQYSATQALQVNGSPNINSRTIATNNPSPADNTYYMFEPGTQPANDMTVRALTLPTTVGANTPIVITGSVRNLGTQAVTGYQLAYSVNGGTPLVDNVTASIGSLGTGPFTHTVPFTPTAAGTYTVKAWTMMPNGQPDAKPFNDTLSRVIQVADSAVQRTVVMESFTSSTCPPCRPGNVNIRAVQRANPGKTIKIAYQQNFPAPGNDPYYTLESGARFNYYNGSFVPYMLLDGGWGDNSNSLTTAILNQFYSVPAFMDVKGSMNRSGSTINATAIITPYLNYDAGLVCYMAIVEKHTRNNARTNGETDFYNVMKKMMPDQNGTTLPALTTRQPYSLSLSYTFPAGNNVEHLDSLEVVMFVQNPTTKQVLNGVMYDQRVSALADEVTFGPLSVAPNPAASGASAVRLALPTTQTVSVEVLDALGRLVATVPARELAAGSHELPLQLNASAHGLYVVRVKTGATTRVRRLVIE